MSETAPDAIQPPVIRPGRAPLVGRSKALESLAEYLAQARRGYATTVFVAGAPGIGKTRLLEEFPSPQLAEGITVLRGGASQAEGMPPYLVFLEALGEYIMAAPADRLRRQLGNGATILASLFPEIPVRLSSISPLYPLGPEQERFRLFESVTAFLAQIASEGPLALLLDDLQWADSATFDLLLHLARRLRSTPLLIVGAYREGDARENPAFLQAQAELNRRRQLVTLSLQPLTADDSQRLASQILSGEIEPDAASLLYRQSEGNPFFLEELIRASIEDGTLVRQANRWTLVSQPQIFLPPRVAEAIQLRLERMKPEVLELLKAAAMVGRTWHPALVAQVIKIDLEQAEEMLLAPVRGQLVKPEVEGAYTFTHDLIRETLRAGVGSARRRRLHQLIAEALEAQKETDTPHWLAELAFHFGEAGDKERGVTYTLAAGEQALRTAATSEGLAHYRTAVRLLGETGESNRRAMALTGLGDAATLSGDYSQAIKAYQTALQLAPLKVEEARAGKIWQKLGKVHWRQEAVWEAREAFERALDLFGPDDSPDKAETLLELADLYVTSLNQHPEGINFAEQALAMVERLGNMQLEATACRVVGNIKARSDDPTQGRALLERALVLGLQLDDPALAAEACGYLANVCAATGYLRRSYEVSLLRVELAQRTQDPFQLRHVYSWLGVLEMFWGNWAKAEKWLAQQAQILAELESPEPWANFRETRGTFYYLQGRFSEAEQEYREALATVRPTGSGALVWYLGRLALCLAELDRGEEALDLLNELQAIASSMAERASARRFAFTQLAIGYARLGEPALAAGCYARLLPFRGQITPLLVDRALGLAAQAGGDTEAARSHFLEAETIAREANLRPELALILLQRGILEQGFAKDDRSAMALAANLLTEGQQLCEELGMQQLGRHLLKVAGITSVPLQKPAKPSRIAGLSEREVEVLRLVAQGQTNREIAQALVLSEKTVARHLTTIFNKTGVDNRSGATAFALRHGLA